MRRREVIWILVGVLWVASCSGDAPTAGRTSRARVTGNKVSMRLAPTTIASEIAFLDRGTELELVGRSREPVRIGSHTEYWFKVRLADGMSGWVYGSNLSVGSAAEEEGPTADDEFREEFSRAIVGKWWEGRPDGSTGWVRLNFWPDGVYKYGLEVGEMQEGRYTIDFEKRTIALDNGSPIGDTIEIRELGSEYRLYGVRTAGNHREVYLRRALIDPDAPELLDEPEEEPGAAETVAPAATP